jgi:putative ABC transport system substrate-binding protein
LAAKNATATIPIVFFHVSDPVGAGLVASLSKPSGNITGVSNIQRELTHKRFELLKSAVPGVSRVGGLIDPTLDIAKVLWQDAEMAAQAAGITVVRLDARSGDELETAFQGIGKAGLQAIVQLGGSTFWVERARIARLAIQNRLPTMLQSPDQVRAGGLMSYGASEVEFLRIAGRLVAKILRGTKPGDLPVEQPTKLELVINLKTAKALGLTIPPSLLARADQIIE